MFFTRSGFENASVSAVGHLADMWHDFSIFSKRRLEPQEICCPYAGRANNIGPIYLKQPFGEGVRQLRDELFVYL